MMYVDGKYAAEREAHIKDSVRQSSPVLVWSTKAGIYVITANRRSSDFRSFKVIDRIACVSRGMRTDGREVIQHVINYAYQIAQIRSRSFHVRELVDVASRMIKLRFGTLGAVPLECEIIIAQLRKDEDYIAHVDYRGTTRTFSRAFFSGSHDPKERTDAKERDFRKKMRQQLGNAWSDDVSIDEIYHRFAHLAVIQESSALSAQFADPNRLEATFLGRAHLANGEFSKIFRRL